MTATEATTAEALAEARRIAENFGFEATGELAIAVTYVTGVLAKATEGEAAYNAAIELLAWRLGVETDNEIRELYELTHEALTVKFCDGCNELTTTMRIDGADYCAECA